MSQTPAEKIPVEDSILASTKKILGIDDSYEVYDLDVVMHINSAFMVLNDLGVGPPGGFVVQSREVPWEAFPVLDEAMLSGVKTYIYFTTRIGFDPPEAVPHLNALQEQAKEMAWRLKERQEGATWVPTLSPTLPVVEE
jgi:hypothetical protein